MINLTGAPLTGLLLRNVNAQKHAIEAYSRTHQHEHIVTPPVVDIEIGTAGVHMSSNEHLVTFDPFDTPFSKPKFEQLQQIISVHDGNATFFQNLEKPGCSSLLPLNSGFAHNKTLYEHDCTPKNGCPLPFADMPSCTRLQHHPDRAYHYSLLPCRRPNPKLGFKVHAAVPTMRLSTFINERGVTRIKNLKIDAQGADAAIVQDVFTRTTVHIDRMMVECQLLDRTPQQYVHADYLPNDCMAVIGLVRNHQPALMTHVSWRAVNCHAAEYDVDFRRTPPLIPAVGWSLGVTPQALKPDDVRFEPGNLR